MKKIFSLLALFVMLVVSGCSCSKPGDYEFDSIVIVKGDKETVYKCTDEEKEDGLVAAACLTYEYTSIELTDEGKAITKIDGNKTSEVFYKIEDGKYYTKLLETDNYGEPIGTWKLGKLTINVGGNKLVFKK